MAKIVSAEVKRIRDLADRHRRAGVLYERLAAHQELLENLERFEARLEDVQADMRTVETAIAALVVPLREPVPEPVPVIEGRG